ncbi:DNA internalization-related competence protein ComEC/Rec2 [soil metagenome]
MSIGLKLAGVGLAWLAGMGWQLQQAALDGVGLYSACVVIGVLVIVAAMRWTTLTVPLWIAVAAVSFGLTGWHASLRLADALSPALEGDDIMVSGVVASMPQWNDGGVRLRFEVDDAQRLGALTRPARPVRIPSQLAIGWYRGFGGASGSAGVNEDAAQHPPPPDLRAGQRWRFTLRLRQPHGNVNPHGFDYELWLFEQGLRATGYVRVNGSAAPRLLSQGHGHLIERLRQNVRDAIVARVADPRAAGVLAALAVGDQAAIGRADWDVFRDAGVAHLMSISGLHVTMFAWLASMLAGACWRRCPGLPLRLPTPSVARWGGVIAALAYALFSGWGVPAQRTVWMLVVAALLQSMSRRWPWPLVLLAGAAVVGAFDPWALLQPGFWLSFMAVGLLMSTQGVTASSEQQGDGARDARIDAGDADAQVDPHQPVWRRWLAGTRREASNGMRTQLVATVGLTPLTLVFFQQVSLVGLAANFIAIPLVTLVITPLALLGVMAPPLWALGAVIVDLMCTMLAWLASWPWAVWTAAASPTWAQLSGLAAALVLLLPLPWRVRVLSLPLVLPLMLPRPELPAEGTFDVVAVDVGQGTAVLVRTRNHLLVYDTGPQYLPESDAGQRVLVPLLKARGEPRIDKLVLSHRDTDHVGGAASLLDAMPTASLLGSLDAGHPLMAHPELVGKLVERCHAGQKWRWDGVDFEVLHPERDDYEAKSAGANRLSCVVLVSGSAIGSESRPDSTATPTALPMPTSTANSSGASAATAGRPQRLLLAGDIEREQESRLVARYGSALRSDVLMAPHHGSRTSSTPAFIAAVAPTMVVFQSGYKNRFGHPAPDVVDRYRAKGAITYGSTECGAWIWTGERRDEASCQRDVARRYWHWVADDLTAADP